MNEGNAGKNNNRIMMMGAVAVIIVLLVVIIVLVVRGNEAPPEEEKRNVVVTEENAEFIRAKAMSRLMRELQAGVDCELSYDEKEAAALLGLES